VTPDNGTGLELVLNAAEGCLQIAVTENEGLLAFEEWFQPAQATETLAWALDGICHRLDMAPASFRRIACVTGPGSFTGIRLVLSTAAALRRAGRAMLGPLDYMQQLSRCRKCWNATQQFAQHARRDLVHARPFISLGPIIPACPTAEIALISPEDARSLVDADDCFVCGSALARYPGLFEPSWANFAREKGPRLVSAITRPSPGSLCLLARHADYFDEDLEPLYVRPCDAVENLPQIAEKMNRDPQETAADLERMLQRLPGGRQKDQE
jgi:tRNA threonylcarbamoyl adenosine modification protein YeaZ